MVNILYRFGATKIVAVAVWMTIDVKLTVLVAVNLMVLIEMSKSKDTSKYTLKFTATYLSVI